MRKILLPVLLMLLPLLGLMAQVSYSFSTGTSTFTALAGATAPALTSPSANFGAADEGYANGLPIGFAFNYNGVSYAQFNVNVNGYMTFGSAFIPDDNEVYYDNNLYGGPEGLTSTRPIIAPLWGDLDLVDAANIKYLLSGTAPNRVLTVEWSKARWSYSGTAATISFQSKLYETTNVIEFLYKRETGGTSNAKASIGITAVRTGPGNFLSLSASSASPTVSSTVENNAISSRPATNQLYRFTPLACIAPSQTSLTNVTPTSATFSWNAIAGVAGYEYAVTTTPGAPASGTATTATSVNITLTAGVNNFIYVRSSCGGASFSTWSQRATVTCTANTAPAQGAITSKTPTLTWNAVNGATGYVIMFGSDANNLVDIGSVAGTTNTATLQNLAYSTTYYFYIRPVIGSDTASTDCASGKTSFKVSEPPVIPCTTNSTPVNASKNISPAVAIASWAAVPNATAYTVMLSSDGGATYVNVGSTDTTTVNLGGAGIIDYNATYYFYIRPVIGTDTATTACKSNATYFKTVAAPAPPANDDCEGAFSVGVALVNATTLGATEYLQAEACNGFAGNANDDVWFKFTAVKNGSASILLTNAAVGLDAVIQAYSGQCGSFVVLGCADNTFDAQDETLTLNNLVAGQTYYFRVYGFANAVDGGTFSIQLNGTALPIQLSNFTGKKVGEKNVLNWTTQVEQNSKGFAMERSADGVNFSKVSFVNSKANGGFSTATLQYQYEDAKPFSGNNYYRLKQTDRDGSFTYSGVVLLKGNKPSVLQLSAVYPNPVRSQLNLVIASPSVENVKIVITDLSGRQLMQQSFKMIGGDNNVQLPVSGLAKGSYLVKAICLNGCETTVQKFIKE